MSGRIRVLNVGQGDAVLVHNPATGAGAIVDCARKGARSARRYVRDEGITDLLGVVVTHLDADHYAGVPHVLQDLKPPPRVLAYGLAKGFRDSHSQLDTFMRQMDGYGLAYNAEYVEPGDGEVIGDAGQGLTLEFLGPSSDERRRAIRHNDANIASAVIRVSVGDLTAIVPGDAPPWRWDRLATAPDRLNADVFLLPHHGAPHDGSSVGLRELLELVDPKVVAISVGSKNGYHHPAVSTLSIAGAWAKDRGRRLVCTQLNCACGEGAAENGDLPAGTACASDITVEHDGVAVRVHTARSDHRQYVERLTAPRCAPVPAEAA